MYIDDAMSQTSQDQDTDVENSADDAGNVSASSYYESTDVSQNGLPSNAPQNQPDAPSRKRKSQVPSTARNPSRRKRLKPYYSDSYRQLLNDTVVNAANGGIETNDDDLNQSQIGITIWSASEKCLFFDNLARKGRDNILGIAAAIGTKSEPEVRAYLLLLDEASTKRQIYSPNESLPGQIEIPAASEISPACESALENAADALAVLQQKDDEKAEKQKQGKTWRLTPKYCRDVNRRMKRDPEHEVQEFKLLPEADLLNLNNFLTLTKLFFMNSTDPQYHWQTYAVDRNERPSIFHTAFSDFHNLVLSVTRRLVRSAIFFAMSRLRAMDGSRKEANRQVRLNDVIAAMNVLGMKKDRHEYWVRLARRCKLNVCDTYNPGSRSKKKMNYDMVERELDRPRDQRGYYTRKSSEISSRASSLSSDASSSIPSDSAPESTTSTTESSESESGSNSSSKLPLNHVSPETITAQDRWDREEDTYISALDQQASLCEEDRLWNLLDRTPPHPSNPDEIQIPKKPRNEPKPLEDINDWRKWIYYAAEWEVLGASKNDWSRQRPMLHRSHNEVVRNTSSRTRRKGKERVAEPMSIDGAEDESGVSDPRSGNNISDEGLDNGSDESASARSYGEKMEEARVQKSDEGSEGSTDSLRATSVDYSDNSDESSALSNGQEDFEVEEHSSNEGN